MKKSLKEHWQEQFPTRSEDDARAYRQVLKDLPEKPNGDYLSATKRRVIVAAAVLAIALWMTGTLDPMLSNVGLNKNPCVVNIFGTKFCGADAKRICREFGGPACKELGYSTKASISGAER